MDTHMREEPMQERLRMECEAFLLSGVDPSQADRCSRHVRLCTEEFPCPECEDEKEGGAPGEAREEELQDLTATLTEQEAPMLNGQTQEKTTMTTKITDSAKIAAQLSWGTVKSTSFAVGALIGAGLMYAGLRLAQAYLENDRD